MSIKELKDIVRFIYPFVDKKVLYMKRIIILRTWIETLLKL